MRKLYSAVLVVCFVLFLSTQSFATVSLGLNNFSSWQRIERSGNGIVQGGASAVAASGGGYSAASVVSESASSSASAYLVWEWYDYSNAQKWSGWNMTLDVLGNPGESAEIIADWNFFSGPVLTAYPSGLFPSGNTAFAATQMNLTMYGFNQGGYFYESIPFYNEQSVVWAGAGGRVVKKPGTLSLGIFDVGDQIEVRGSHYARTYAYSNPYGSNAANLISMFNTTLTPYTQSNAVPEPATLVLMGIGLTGMALRRRKKV